MTLPASSLSTWPPPRRRRLLLALLLVLLLPPSPTAQAQDTPPPDAFVTTWQTRAPGEAITLPTRGGEEAPDYAFTIDWGDGTTETIEGDDPDPAHAYAEPGTHTVAITGTFPHLFLDASGAPHGHGPPGDANARKLLAVEQWGAIAWANMHAAFAGATRLAVTATDAPDLSRVTDARRMFAQARSFDQPIGHWDVSHVTTMRRMFEGAAAFNQPLGDWDVSGVTDMRYLFRGAEAFNQPIGDWDVSGVTRMAGLFMHAETFNQPIGAWDVSGVTDMSYVFRRAAAFNQPLDTWDVSRVTDMESMFAGARAFDQPLGTWDVSRVTDMQRMFAGVALAPAHYDALLLGWSQQDVQPDVRFGAGASRYTEAAEAARERLTGAHEWRIDDGGLCPAPCGVR